MTPRPSSSQPKTPASANTDSDCSSSIFNSSPLSVRSPYQLGTSSSASSSVSSGSFDNWFSAPSTSVMYRPNPASRLVPVPNEPQSIPRPVDNYPSSLFTSQSFAAQDLPQALGIASETTPSWTDFAFGLGDAFAYVPSEPLKPSSDHLSHPAPSIARPEICLSSWSAPQQSPSQRIPPPQCSLPSTPKLPRQTHRFSSLPSLNRTNDIGRCTGESSNPDSSSSPLRSGPSAAFPDTRYSAQGTSPSFLPDIFQSPMSW
jgi:hypothetical protein